MKKYDVLRTKAVRLRENGHTLPEICERLQVSKSTAWYWIRDVELKRPNAFLGKTKRSNKKAALKAAEAHRRNSRKRHEENAEEARRLWYAGLRDDEEFKLFMMLYIAEGIRKDPKSYGITNTDPHVIVFAHKMMKRLNANNRDIRLDLSMTDTFDQEKAMGFWKGLLGAEYTVHVYIRKAYGDLSHRNWVSKFGILRLRVYDSYVKTRIDTWMDLFKHEILSRSL